jgi:hypothetical protein
MPFAMPIVNQVAHGMEARFHPGQTVEVARTAVPAREFQHEGAGLHPVRQGDAA